MTFAEHPFEAYSGGNAYIFVSYSHEDTHLVYPELVRLHKAGYRIWYDEGIDPGNEWTDEVAKALEHCRFFLVFITPRSVESKNVINEINFAINRKKLFCAIHLEETELPGGLELRMGDTQAILKYKMDDERYQRQITKALPDYLKEDAEMVLIPAGEFLYGDNKERKYLPDYYIMKNPVSVAQYLNFCDVTNRKRPDPPEPWGWIDNHPVVNVTWQDAKDYADWAGFALPTDEEWEKAARGTDGREYPWGNGWDPSKCCHKNNSFDQTAPLGSYKNGASPYGILDMSGNVWELCDSWYLDNKTRVIRGGSWFYYDITFFCTHHRHSINPLHTYEGIGFRCVQRIKI